MSRRGADKIGIHTMVMPLRLTLPTTLTNTAAKPTRTVWNVPQTAVATVTNTTKTIAIASNA